MAIVVAARHTDLLGITTVSGNAPLDRTTHNALVMRDLLGVDVPVHSGAERPLVAPRRHAPSVHGVSGLDGADLPVPTTPLDSTDAVTFIIDTVRSVDGVWLVAVGPLTNIALAIRQAPDLVDRVAGVSLMGGGTFGNHSPVGEFNIWADPEAAAVVFSSGVPLVMAGLDVTHQFQATPDRIAAVAAVPGRLGAVLSDLMDFFSTAYIARHESIVGAPIHDPLAVLALTHRHLFTSTQRHVAVETRGEITRGMTVIDQRNVVARPAPNCDVLDTVDADGAFTVLLDAIATCSPLRPKP